MLCFLNQYTRMGGTELIYNLFSECRTGSGNDHYGICIVDPGSFKVVWPVASSILVAMLVKGGLTIITFGIKLPAGIFIPTLGVGACAGRLMGIAMEWLQMNYPNSRAFDACGGDADCKELKKYKCNPKLTNLQASFPVSMLWSVLRRLFLV